MVGNSSTQKQSPKCSLKEFILIFILLLILGIQIGSISYDKGWFSYRPSIGISNGKPYCLKCIAFESNLLKPLVGDYIVYEDIDFARVSHKLIDETNNYFIIELYNGYYWKREYIEKNKYLSTILLTIPWNTTDDIKEACEYESSIYNLNWNCSEFVKSI